MEKPGPIDENDLRAVFGGEDHRESTISRDASETVGRTTSGIIRSGMKGIADENKRDAFRRAGLARLN